MKKGLMLLLLLVSPLLHAALQEHPVDYTSGDTTLKGYLVWDDAVKGKRPGILVVHEFWGLNDYARKRARMLAELGYTALAVDMYGNGKIGEHPREATEFMNAVLSRADIAKARFLAAKTLLEQQPTVDKRKIAAIGYCFGGGVVLMMAREGVDLRGVVSFHGLLNAGAPAQPGHVKARILVENGADDSLVKPEDIIAFKHEMDTAGAHYQFDNLPGAKHSFTNPDADEFAKKFDLPIGYNADADHQSWSTMQAFLHDIFAK
ncbi:MAG TPA: dienelactone hydrolase family protein [Spongiibacteraceae bacterium]|nr:dienelactone hydrolase family protein [Spongiibacteraceae bacterium]